MSNWKVTETPDGLQLLPDAVRDFGSEEFTWAHLLYGKLGSVQVYVIYFPSRFDLDMDTTVKNALRTFGKNTGPGTSVNFWSPKDPEFPKALDLFKLATSPALVLVSGLKLNDIEPYGPDKANLFTITITDPQVLSNRELLAGAVNSAHDVLARSNPKEITSYIRKNAAHSLLQAVTKVAGQLLDVFLKLKPKFQLPDGTSLQIGG